MYVQCHLHPVYVQCHLHPECAFHHQVSFQYVACHLLLVLCLYVAYRLPYRLEGVVECLHPVEDRPVNRLRLVEDHLVGADGHHLEVDRREAAEDLQEAAVAGRQAEEAEDPRGAARVDLLLPSPRQGARPGPDA